MSKRKVTKSYQGRKKNSLGDREKIIKENIPSFFEIEQHKFPYDIGVKTDAEYLRMGVEEEIDDARTFDVLGVNTVREFDKQIMNSSQKNNIDPDLVRAVMYAENARGHKFGMNALADKLKVSKSVMPMNIQKDRWSGLVEKNQDDMHKSEVNIEVATVLLSRIRDRIIKPTPEKIGTLWNNLEAKNTNKFGEYIGDVYKKKPWARFE